MTNSINRRAFNRSSILSASALAIGTAVPDGWVRSLAARLTDEKQKDRILIVIQLSGGNDGLNTIVPYADERYLKARPKLAIPKSDVITLDGSVGLHPSMRGIAKLIEDQKFATIHGVGYANPNRSHFESMDIWHSCQRKESRGSDGWLGRLFSHAMTGDRVDSMGLHLGGEPMPLALVGRGIQTPSIATVDQFRWKGKTDSMREADNGTSSEPGAAKQGNMESGGASEREADGAGLLDFVSASTTAAMQASDRLEKALATSDSAGDFPDSQLGEKLKVISRLILAGLNTKVYYVTLDGFDTHANQAVAHAGLLKQWSEALSAFHRRLDQAGQGDRALVMTFSEFGRRVSENASQGTDHGAAAPAFLSGPHFGKPFYGEQPSLSDLDDGDLKFKIDFRSLYATVIEEWLGQPADPVLGENYSKIDGIKLG